MKKMWLGFFSTENVCAHFNLGSLACRISSHCLQVHSVSKSTVNSNSHTKCNCKLILSLQTMVPIYVFDLLDTVVLKGAFFSITNALVAI